MDACRWRWIAGLAAVLLLLGGCDGSGGDQRSGVAGVERVFPDLAFPGMTDIRSRPDASGIERLFVAQKAGRIRVFRPGDAVPSARTFLDISGLADFSAAGEGGLLGLAFDPDYASNHYFYVHYTKANPRRVVIARFTDDGARPVSLMSEADVLAVDYPPAYTNHVAGGLAFGPADGMLYVTLGDGGGSFDPSGNGQDRTTLLGSILRLDVSSTTIGGAAPNYTIPQDNPFFGNANGYREEIHAWGLRNPWRISLESLADGGQRLWVGDVGQNEREEVDVVTAGGNYGWDCWEGTLAVPVSERSPLCPTLGSGGDFRFPVAEYTHEQGNAITGGYVYTGTRLPSLVGAYVFGDFGSGRIWAFDPVTDFTRAVTDSDLAISTFGVGTDGTLYIGDYGGGLYRLTRDRALAVRSPG